MSVGMDKRPYHSPLRQEQALATRQRILDAALELFGAQGYGATSIAAVAREAGGVPETIYATLGSTRAQSPAPRAREERAGGLRGGGAVWAPTGGPSSVASPPSRPRSGAATTTLRRSSDGG